MAIEHSEVAREATWADFNAAIQGIDTTTFDLASLGDLAGQIGSTRAALDGLEARIAASLRKLGTSEATTAETIRRRTGCSTREAKHRTRRAETLEKMPNVADALSSGRLTGEHATALARAAAETSPEAVDGDAGLLAEAAAVPADLASSKTRDWARKHQTDDDLHELHLWQRRNRSLNFAPSDGGMLAGIARFDRVSGAQFQSLVEALAERLYRADGGRDNPNARTRTQCRHDALLALVGIEPQPMPADDPANLNGTAASLRGPGQGAGSRITSSDAPVHTGNNTPTKPNDRLTSSDEPAPTGDNTPPKPNDRLASSGEPPSTGNNTPTKPNDRLASSDEPAPTGDDNPPNPGGTAAGMSDEATNAGNGNARESDPSVESGRSGSAISSGFAGGRGLGVRGQLLVVMDLPFLANGGAQGRCEVPGVGPLVRSELERLACDADIYGLIFSGDGLPLNHGRRVRTVSPQQWRMLVARDRRCVICGARPEWCQAHHIRPWLKGGRTDLANLALVCHAHHRWIHDNNVVLQQGRDGWKAPPALPPPERLRAATRNSDRDQPQLTHLNAVPPEFGDRADRSQPTRNPARR